MVVALTIA
ncbi:hypothetical protein VCHC41A1_1734, partial [Vibrio cholerae HC-41A1]